jgi:uncharacterized membrane protein
MKKSTPVPAVMQSGVSYGLLFKILAIFSLVLIILVVIFLATSRKRIENFDTNASCSQTELDKLKQQMITAKCDCRKESYQSKLKALDTLKSSLAEVQIHASIFNKTLSNQYNEFRKNLLDQAEKEVFDEKEDLDDCYALMQEYQNCMSMPMLPTLPTLPAPSDTEPLPSLVEDTVSINAQITEIKDKIASLKNEYAEINSKLSDDPSNVFLLESSDKLRVSIRENESKLQDLESKIAGQTS